MPIAMSTRDHVLNDFLETSLQAAMKLEVAHAAQYEQQITALEKSLAHELKKTRATVALYREKKALVDDHIRLAKQENWLNAPMIIRALQRSREVVNEVEWKLPGIRSQLMEIRNVYELGRRRAQKLQAEMEWKAKSDFDQWRSTLVGKSPLSPQQVKREWLKLIWRLFLAALILLIFLYLCSAAIHCC